MINEDLKKKVEAAMFAKDELTLEQIAPCRCCCKDHTFSSCPARLWGGCRSGEVIAYPW